METLRIDILNPKAKKLLKDLADLDLIRANKDTDDTSEFSAFVKMIRKKSDQEMTLEEITKEVESIRTARYEK